MYPQLVSTILSNTTDLVTSKKITSSARNEIPHATSAFIVVVFIGVLLPPAYFDIGSLRLSFSRVFLLFAIIPLLIRLLSGRVGALLLTDYLMMMYSAWIAITYTYHYGADRIGLSGITITEQFGAYLVGRTLIRNATDYMIFIRSFFVALLFLFPFAAFELFTGINILTVLLDPIMSVHIKGQSAYGRIGLERVMSGFEHPILFGIFCSLGMANFFYIFKPNLFKALSMMALTAGMTFMSLSSAPLMAISSQAFMIAWDRFTKGRWLLLAILVVTTYVVIDLLSNRTPVTILISTLTFDANSAWTRVSIWDYGYASVKENPFMGIGLEDWPRPGWLTSSVDNFWLLISMRHGVPALVLLLGALASHLFVILRVKYLTPTLQRYRTGYVLALLCLYFSLCTVHIWGGISSFVFFYFGAGLWFADAARERSASRAGTLSTDQHTAHPSRAAAVSGYARHSAEQYVSEIIEMIEHRYFNMVGRSRQIVTTVTT
jgi:hypothetical protein